MKKKLNVPKRRLISQTFFHVPKEIDLLQLMLIDFGKDENLTRNKLKITEEQHTKSLMGLQDLLAKKDQKIKFLEEKNFHLEEDAMRIKLRQEDLKKNFTRELERRCCQIKIYEKEAELSKEQVDFTNFFLY